MMCRVFFLCGLICLLSSSIIFGKDSNDLLGYILTGVSENAGLVKNISFDYSVDHQISEYWKTQIRESMRKQLKDRGLPEQFPRLPYNEHTIRTGSFIRDMDAFKITSKVIANADKNVFMDESVISNKIKVTKMDKKSKSAVISRLEDYRNDDISFFPDSFQNLLFDGKTLQEVSESNNISIAYIGKQMYEGTECEILETTCFFATPEGINDFTKDRVWVAPGNSFLIKYGISFKADPNKPINSITAEFEEVSPGIWYYSKILFKSFPSGNIKPDVTMCLTISDIKLNRILPEETFLPDLSAITNIKDETK
jgi:hypothetical protein